MLKKSEELVLKVILDNAYNNESCLISKESIVAFIGKENLVSLDNVESLLSSLYSNDYIDLLLSSRKGEKLYCITLLKKGKSYNEKKKQELKLIKNKIILAVICALVSFIVGRILVAIFN